MASGYFGDIPYLRWSLPGAQVLVVDGVSEPYYDVLNGDWVYLYGGKVRRRRLSIAGEFVYAEDGFVYDSVTVPSGSVAVLSDKNIKLPFKHKSTKGYNYVDVIEGKFCYILPKEVLLKPPMYALVLSSSKSGSYRLHRVDLKGFGRTYLKVVRYSPGRRYANSRVLSVGVYGDGLFSEEMADLVKLWESLGIYNGMHRESPSHFNMSGEFERL